MKECCYCEKSGGLDKNVPDDALVLVHAGCVRQLMKQVHDGLQGINEISNLAAEKYATVYNQYEDKIVKKEKAKP